MLESEIPKGVFIAWFIGYNLCKKPVTYFTRRFKWAILTNHSGVKEEEFKLP